MEAILLGKEHPLYLLATDYKQKRSEGIDRGQALYMACNQYIKRYFDQRSLEDRFEIQDTQEVCLNHLLGRSEPIPNMPRTGCMGCEPDEYNKQCPRYEPQPIRQFKARFPR